MFGGISCALLGITEVRQGGRSRLSEESTRLGFPPCTPTGRVQPAGGCEEELGRNHLRLEPGEPLYEELPPAEAAAAGMARGAGTQWKALA